MGWDDITYGGNPSNLEEAGELGLLEFYEDLLLYGGSGDVGGGPCLLVHPNYSGCVVLV